MKILVTGKNGQLGRSINKIINTDYKILKNKNLNKFIFVGRYELDLSIESSITNYFNNNKFDVIINCAAYTAVDKAEQEVDLANQINHLAIRQLAKIAKNQQARLIYISTDYVFDGESDKPYKESSTPNPINIYAKTKLAGEQALLELMLTDAIIIRTSWLYSEYGNNFISSMLKLGHERREFNIVNDQIGSPTYATDLAIAIIEIIDHKKFQSEDRVSEIYHYSNNGEVSWYEFAKEIFKLAGIDCKLNPITSNQYPQPAQRPKNTFMNKDKIVKIFGVTVSDWKKSLKQCFKVL